MILIFFSFGYVRDGRIDLLGIAPKAPEYYYSPQINFLTDKKIDIKSSLTPKQWQIKAIELGETISQPFLFDSFRFKKIQQAFLSLGSYPRRMEAKDGFLIPGGSSLEFRPKLSGRFLLRISATSLLQDSSLVVEGSEYGPKEFPLIKASNPIDRNSLYYKTVQQFTDSYLNEIPSGGSWSSIKHIVELASRTSLKFTCKNSEAHCFISSPEILKKIDEPKNPSLIFILVDTLRYDGITSLKAPLFNLHKSDFVHYRNAISSGNMTSPATNSVLSCRAPHQVGRVAFSYGVTDAEREHYYKNSKPSFPQYFQKNGYKTAMIGNISILSEVKQRGVNHGFSEQISTETEGYETPHTYQESIKWLDNHKNQPFFLYLHFNSTHGPYKPPLQDAGTTFRGIKDLFSRDAFLKWAYRGEVAYLDRYLDKLFRYLKSIDLYDSTMVVLTSDHGEHFGPHDFIYNELGPPMTGGYFDHGATLFNDEIKVPLYIKPFNIEDFKSKKVDRYVSNLSLGPTIMKAFNLKPPAYCYSKEDLLSPTKQKKEEVILSEGLDSRSIIFKKRYKYIKRVGPINKYIVEPGKLSKTDVQIYVKEQLYDLNNDPTEQLNLIYANPNLLSEARTHFKQAFELEEHYELTFALKGTSRFSYQTIEKDEKNPFLKPRRKKDRLYTYEGVIQDQLTITLNSKVKKILNLKINGKKEEIFYTNLALKLGDNFILTKLPLNNIEKKPAGIKVLLKKKSSNEKVAAKIVATNPEMEAILKEWGYLKD